MKKITTTFLGIILIGGAFAQTTKNSPSTHPATSAKPSTGKPSTSKTVLSAFKNNKDSASYALGVRIAQNLQSQSFGKLDVTMLQKGLGEAMQNKALALPEAVLDKCIGVYQQNANAEKSLKTKAEGKKFLEENAKRKGVITTKSGLQYEIIKTGADSVKPALTDKVKCHYHGTLINGTVFDSSVDRGEPASFSVNGVIAGWTEALQLMTVGSKWKLYIPSELAYGDRQTGPSIAPGSTLIFTVEILEIEK